jgi:hypothetical protein
LLNVHVYLNVCVYYGFWSCQNRFLLEIKLAIKQQEKCTQYLNVYL